MGVKILLFFLWISLFLFPIAYLVMYLWNELLPELFSLPAIGYWQALGLLVLSRILFGEFAGFGGPWRGVHRRGPWADRWHKLSEQEKAEYRERWQQWCRREADSVKTGATGSAS